MTKTNDSFIPQGTLRTWSALTISSALTGSGPPTPPCEVGPNRGTTPLGPPVFPDSEGRSGKETPSRSLAGDATLLRASGGRTGASRGQTGAIGLEGRSVRPRRRKSGPLGRRWSVKKGRRRWLVSGPNETFPEPCHNIWATMVLVPTALNRFFLENTFCKFQPA